MTECAIVLTSLERCLVEYELGFASDSCLVEWALSELDGATGLASDPDLIELASLPARRSELCAAAPSLLRAIALRAGVCLPAPSVACAAHVQACLLKVCERLVAGSIQPYEFCVLLSPIEEMFSSPSWLEDLYDHCDWCTPSSSRDDFMHLVDYAREYISKRSSEPVPPLGR